MIGHHPQGRHSRGGDEPLLGHLMACAPPKSRRANATSAILSLLGHGGLLMLAVWLTSIPAVSSAPAQRIIDVTLPPDPVPPPTPAPPQVATEPEQAAAAAAALPGYRTLDPPTIVPTEIPLPRMGTGVDEIDYGGMGVAGGSGRGTADSAPAGSGEDVARAPIFVPVTVAPALKNRAEVERALVRLYPALLRDAGVGGRVVVWVLVDEGGSVVKGLVKEGSGYPQLDRAALEVADAMRFSPGFNRDMAVKVWVAVPVEFRVNR